MLTFLDNSGYIRYTVYRIKPLLNGCDSVQEYKIEFYDKADGSEPAKEFILSLDLKRRAKVLRTVALLRDAGPFLREPYSKPQKTPASEIALAKQYRADYLARKENSK